jgi:hypothetical protein
MALPGGSDEDRATHFWIRSRKPAAPGFPDLIHHLDGRDLVRGRLGVKPVRTGVPLADLGPSQLAGNPGQQQAVILAFHAGRPASPNQLFRSDPVTATWGTVAAL